ncbi:MAG: hypothetical protein BGO67_00120 [Alphaproteobacteria bacterium 41-28]|nr:MAG: hypothetical protein BGO67_00120 [Alphaproteobacteria bacterium 41-28]
MLSVKKKGINSKKNLNNLEEIFPKVSSSLQSALKDEIKNETLVINNKEEVIFKTFIKNIPAAIALFDKNLNYIITSDRWTKETNLNIKDIKGKNIYDVVPDLPQKWRKIHQNALKGEHLKSEDDLFKRRNGSVEWWRWEALPWYTPHGNIGGIILFVELITKRKLLEKKMKETIHALNRSNAELERFAHICAHDLNEPLRTIANYSHIIEDEFKDKFGRQAKQYLENISKNIKHMSTLVNGILTYSQYERSGLNKSFFSLQHIMTSIKMILEKKINDKNAFIYSDNMPLIYGDRVFIARVFQNLITNALKFNESDIPIIYITAKEKKSSFVFSVEDNGIGIDPKYHHKIFDLFERLHHTSKYEGTGVGLSVSKKIIEAHGGKIWLKSSLANGSQFFFSLPKVPQAEMDEKET